MPRTLKAGYQCEYLTPGFGKRPRCTVIHHDRSDGGAPKQLYPVKIGNTTGFMCREHAPLYSMFTTTKGQKRKKTTDEQQSLL